MFFLLLLRPPPRSPLFPYTTLFRSQADILLDQQDPDPLPAKPHQQGCEFVDDHGSEALTRLVDELAALLVRLGGEDRKSTRLNSSHLGISYAVFCLKKKKNIIKRKQTRHDARTRDNRSNSEQASVNRHDLRQRIDAVAEAYETQVLVDGVPVVRVVG